MDQIGAYEAKTNLPKLLRRVAQGASFLITQRGVPIARLVPLEDDRKEARAAIERIRARRRGKPAISADEIRDMIDEGRKR